jgi:lipopolysaccharide heptosyltransferase II
MRLLIVLPGAIGDVVRALPLLGRIRAGRPDAWIAWMVEPPSAPLLHGHPWLDQVIVFRRQGGLGAVRPLVREVRAGGFDVALDLGRGIKSAAVAWISGARERLAFAGADARESGWRLATRHLPPQGIARPKLEQFLAFGDLLRVPPVPVAFGLAPTADEERRATELVAGLPEPVLAACIGSSCPSRRWFPERTAAALDALTERGGGSAMLLGTADDAAQAAAIVAATRAPVRDLVGRTSLRGLLAVLARSALAFGPDSGALHLAAAVGTPVVSLWGATSAARSAPFGSQRFVVEGEAPCRPCFLTGCPIGRVCMRAITPEIVVERAREALAA